MVLKQRNDLIPNLVASLKAYMGHENEILTRIAELRSRADGAPEAEQIKDGTEISELFLNKLRPLLRVIRISKPMSNLSTSNIR